MNDYQFKLVKIKNDFTWHAHEDTDEVFIVIEGSMQIEFEDETIEKLQEEIAARLGFQLLDHSMNLIGSPPEPCIRPDCRQIER